ncbi:selenide, water dikinase [Helicovermis profundi]|uniref:Selenide, water dikinase n=1 Tax=Helicovermis profundi TaxID=3065157 RepID=A0AAU9EU06_9FIRM|nr:selenide, water dikinase [Clostridia bacterium S502]
MCNLPKFEDENLIIGLETSDDAAVYKIDDEKAIIQTLDFFTPIVDDPYMFGQIAAANSLSDVYAMGGEPTIALNIVAFPTCLDMNILSEILRGGAEKVKEAGAILVGGHSVDDPEPKYGLSVTGMVHPDKVLSNSSAKPGDVLVLTKPIGTGILSTCIKADMLSKEEIDKISFVMSYLNKDAADGIKQVNVNSCTDITGFGLAGHAYEMAKGSQVTVELDFNKIPILNETISNAEMGLIPAGTYRNRDYIEGEYLIDDSLEEYVLDIVFDPQTSGGLLISLPEKEALKLMNIYKTTLKTEFAVVGRVLEKEDFSLIIK